MNGLGVDDYYEWLGDFEAMEIMESVNDIFAIYHAQTRTTSKSKKNP